MPRHLRYVVVESGKCEHCGRDAGAHGIDGICDTNSSAMHDHKRKPDQPERCFRSEQQYAFIDLDSWEIRAWIIAAAKHVAL